MPISIAKSENLSQEECYYILLIKEHLAAGWSEWFEGLTVSYIPTGETQLSGFIPDQSALHGLLARIRDLNLTLISVNRAAIDTQPEDLIKNEPTNDHMEDSHEKRA